MKYITKNSQPKELIAWIRDKLKDEKKLSLPWNYDDMPGNIRQAVKASLIREQGGICCYTGRRITPETSHIEHLKPQASCVEHEDTDYSNLLAAYPSSNASTECEYGAHIKKSWYHEHLFVHPLRRDCETRFRYRLNGKIVQRNLDDEGASATIQQLRLNHAALEKMRESAIYTMLFEEKLSKTQVERLMAAMDNRDGKGNFRPFCFVLKQACEKYLKRFDAPPKQR